MGAGGEARDKIKRIQLAFWFMQIKPPGTYLKLLFSTKHNILGQ